MGVVEGMGTMGIRECKYGMHIAAVHSRLSLNSLLLLLSFSLFLAHSHLLSLISYSFSAITDATAGEAGCRALSIAYLSTAVAEP